MTPTSLRRSTPWLRDLPLDRIIPWVVPAALVVLWQVLAQVGLINSRILPAPTDVVQAAIRLTLSGELLRHVGISAWRATVGFLIGGGIGLFFGVLNGVSRPAELLADSSIQMIRNVPHLAMIPLVILWFGIGDEARIFLVALGVLFPIYVNTFYGIRAIDPGLIEMGRVYGLSRRELFSQIIFPGALPSVLVGLRYALGTMWLTLIVAETIAATSGIGYMAMNAREFMQTDVVVLSILLYALLGKLADAAVRVLERLWLDWHPSQHV
ncbi:MAG: aliphatic sulfonate ABC transporter permease SsuC, partial [Cyanobacteria bacterium Co-bin13]|nr:aliphatic sulfonate ABC transporter permease SsuC [Cyanobacteria bacterium Co-bin13]